MRRRLTLTGRRPKMFSAFLDGQEELLTTRKPDCVVQMMTSISLASQALHSTGLANEVQNCAHLEIDSGLLAQML